MTNTKRNFTEIEAIIEERIAKESAEFELDRWDIADIRLETYKANGWSFDPFPEEEEEMEDYGEEYHYRSMDEMLAEIGMSAGDFF